MSTDALVLLKDDHTQIRRLFREFEGAGENATKAEGAIVDRILSLLTVHTYLENEVVYPGVRQLLPDVEDHILESYEEHHVADMLCLELAAMSPDDERYTPKNDALPLACDSIPGPHTSRVNRRPTPPATIRIIPTMLRSTPETSASTATLAPETSAVRSTATGPPATT